MPTPSNHSKNKIKKNYHPTATDDTNIANSVKPSGPSTNRKGRRRKKRKEKENHPFIAHSRSTLVYHLTH
jgi:hypothetical protein